MADPAGAAFERLTDALTAHGHTLRHNGERQAMAQCPAHPDRTPSLSLTRAETRVLIRCHAGCDTDDVLTAIGLTRADLFDEARPQHADRPPDTDWVPCKHRKTAEYPYRDEAGQLLYAVTRCDQKCFAQWRPDPASKTGRRWSLGDVRRVPYRLPELRAAITTGDGIWIVEGEKDVAAILARPAGAAATCNSGGAGKWRPEFADLFRGADVNICADRDAPGEEHARAVVENLLPVANSILVLQPRWGKDATDHLAAGGHLGNFTTVWEPIAYTGPADS